MPTQSQVVGIDVGLSVGRSGVGGCHGQRDGLRIDFHGEALCGGRSRQVVIAGGNGHVADLVVGCGIASAARSGIVVARHRAAFTVEVGGIKRRLAVFARSDASVEQHIVGEVERIYGIGTILGSARQTVVVIEVGRRVGEGEAVHGLGQFPHVGTDRGVCRGANRKQRDTTFLISNGQLGLVAACFVSVQAHVESGALAPVQVGRQLDAADGESVVGEGHVGEGGIAAAIKEVHRLGFHPSHDGTIAQVDGIRGDGQICSVQLNGETYDVVEAIPSTCVDR